MPLRVAALQFDVRRGDVEHNVSAVERGLRAASGRGARLIVLPEMWPTSFPESAEDAPHGIEPTRAAWSRVARTAGELGVVVVGSGFGPPVAGESAVVPARPSNRLLVLDGARELARYDKVHLFSPTAETEVFAAGREPPPTLDTSCGRLAGLICYDLRFPELTRAPFEQRAEIVCVPAQWPAARASHFRALCAGLAASGQCFVVAANRTGRERVGRRGLELAFPGNSVIVDPHGCVLAEGAGEEGTLEAEIDLDVARELRRRVPVDRDRRPELYARWRSV